MTVGSTDLQDVDITREDIQDRCKKKLQTDQGLQEKPKLITEKECGSLKPKVKNSQDVVFS